MGPIHNCYTFQAFLAPAKILKFEFDLTDKMIIYTNARLTFPDKTEYILESKKKETSVMIVLPPEETRYLLTSQDDAEYKIKQKQDDARLEKMLAKSLSLRSMGERDDYHALLGGTTLDAVHE